MKAEKVRFMTMERRDALEVPEGVQGGVGDVIPDALTEGIDVTDRVVFTIGSGVSDVVMVQLS